MKKKTKYLAGLLAALMLPIVAQAQFVGPTNFMVYSFDSDQVSGIWGNWFGGDFGSTVWDPAVDAGGSPSSGSLLLTVNAGSGFPQFVMWDNATPAYSGLPLQGTVAFTNLSFDMRYDVTSAIRTNGDGSMDFGVLRAGSRNLSFNQDWYNYWSIPATNGAGLPNTNWIHRSVDLTSVPANFGDLAASGLVNTMIAADNGNYNPTLRGQQLIWFDNIQYKGWVSPVPPPTMSIEKAIPALRLFGGSGQYGRAQVQLVDTGESWLGGAYPVSYSFTVLDNATSPGGLDYHIHLIQGTDGYSGADYTQPNVLWLQIISGTGGNPACVANVSWKTNSPNSNPNQTTNGQIALTITNTVLAGTWTLTFNSETNGTLTAPGASPAPFSLSLPDTDVITYFSNPVEVRFGIQNNGNTANGGVPHDWAKISVSGTLGTQISEDFTKAGTNQLDTTIWDLGHSDGVGVINLVPTNAPYWIKWTLPDSGFSLNSGTSLTSVSNWNGLANVAPISQSGVRWALIPGASLPAGPASYFAVVKRSFNQLQVLLPGETNAPGTLTGKVGTPDHVSLAAGGVCSVTVNAVDSTYHIALVSGDMISVTCSDLTATPPAPAALVNGTVIQQVIFGSTGSFTVTATDTTHTNTSSSVTVDP